MLSSFIGIFGLWLFYWYVNVRRTEPRKAALAFGIAIAALHLVMGRPLDAALVGGALAGTAAWLLVWVNDRFHSLATIPLWFLATVGLWLLMNAALH